MPVCFGAVDRRVYDWYIGRWRKPTLGLVWLSFCLPVLADLFGNHLETKRCRNVNLKNRRSSMLICDMDLDLIGVSHAVDCVLGMRQSEFGGVVSLGEMRED